VPVYLRYMDDIIFFGDDKECLKDTIDRMTELVNGVELGFKPAVVADTEAGVTFLGYKLRRHCITLNARSRNRLKKKLKNYETKLDKGCFSEAEYNEHITPLIAFAQKAYSKRLRSRLLHIDKGQSPYARTACCAAVAGTTTRGTAECRTVTTTTPTTATTTTASALFFPSLMFQGMDFPGEVKQATAPIPPCGTKRADSLRQQDRASSTAEKRNPCPAFFEKTITL